MTKTYGCNADYVCAQVGVDPKHWRGFAKLCCCTSGECKHRVEVF